MNESPALLSILTTLSLASFLTTSGLMVLGFRPAGGSRFWMRLSYLLFLCGTICLTLASLTQNSTGYLLAAAIAWLSIISWFIWNIELIGAFTSPVIAILLLVHIFFQRDPVARNLSLETVDLRLHIGSALAGQALAVLACGMSLLLLWLDRKLKARQLSDLPDSFPAMATLARALHITLGVGFTFLTVSLLSGAVFVMNGNLNPEANIIGKTIWAIFVWIWYLSILVLRGILGYRPQKVARLSLLGFAIMTIGWIFVWYFAPWGQR